MCSSSLQVRKIIITRSPVNGKSKLSGHMNWTKQEKDFTFYFHQSGPKTAE
jgi:hypothetical protein